MHDCTNARMPGTQALLRLCLFVWVGLGVACAHGQARTAPEMPPLAMPEPPPRVVEVATPVPPPQIALPDEPVSTIRPRPAPTPRTDAPRPDATRTETPATEAARPPEEPPRAGSPTTLQTAPTQREGAMERRVRILIAQAFNDLNRVNYQALDANARNQYDTAKRFAIQAEEALQGRNLVFAQNLADKAAALAAQLLGR